MSDFDGEDSGEAGVEPKRGPLSREDRQRLLELHEAGHSHDEIAEALQRTTGLVKKTLEGTPKKKKNRVPPAPAPPAPKPRARGPTAAAGGGQTLRHRFWLRPHTQVEFELPADLQASEVERLVDFLQALRFRP